MDQDSLIDLVNKGGQFLRDRLNIIASRRGTVTHRWEDFRKGEFRC